MTYTETVIPGVWIIEPKVLKDARGYFMEALSKRNSRSISENPVRAGQRILLL